MKDDIRKVTICMKYEGGGDHGWFIMMDKDERVRIQEYLGDLSRAARLKYGRPNES